MANIDKYDQLYLRHILEAIEKINRNIKDKTYESFIADEVLLGFVIYELAKF